MQPRSTESLKRQIEQYLSSADENIKASEKLINEGFYRIAISRIYYAFLDAANALLLTKDLRPKSHGGTISLFGKYFVKTGIIDPAYGKRFTKIEKFRLEADYQHEKNFDNEVALEVLEEASDFIKLVKSLKDKLLPE